MDESPTVVVSTLLNFDGVAALDACDAATFDTALDPLLREIDDPTTTEGGHNS